jgi:hypothetical protein
VFSIEQALNTFLSRSPRGTSISHPMPALQVRVEMPVSRQSSARRRSSVNSLEGQRGTLRTTKQTLHGDLSIRDRIRHFTLAWFTCTMSTGGIALLLSQTPHRFNGLQVLGHIVFIFNIVLFILFCAALMTRFVLFPKTLMGCLTHPTESLFVPTFCTSHFAPNSATSWVQIRDGSRNMSRELIGSPAVKCA